VSEDEVRQKEQEDLPQVVVRKNASEVVVVRPTEFNGIALVDARVYVADAHGKPET